jgi:hypothetical protein
MKRMVVQSVFLMLLTSAPASATAISWGPASVTDDNGGLFLLGATASRIGSTFTLNLPGYSTTSQFGFPPNEVDLAVTATDVGAQQIIGLTYTLLGSFTGAGRADFAIMANAASALGSFATASRVGTIRFAGATTVNLSSVLHLDDGGDSAAVRSVQFTLLETPEPTTIILLASGLILGRRGLARRRSTDRQ